MSSKEAHPVTDVDIDPGWYPGQPELLEEGAGAPGFQEDGYGAAPPGAAADDEQEDGTSSVGTSAAAGAGDNEQHQRGHGGRESSGGGEHGRSAARAEPLRRPVSVPTVLTKLQKWGDYESVGAQVLPTKFIPMKTPLSAEILDSWSLPTQPKHRLTVPEMVAQQAALGRKVGLLLDLSNHDCLYTADIPPGLNYTHIQLVAKELPPPEFVDTVVAVANRFWRAHPDEYIAVHCAYGFNRTGFVVCCYLIECCGLSVEDALSAFAESRPPGVKHEQFRAELHRRYDGLAGLYGGIANGLNGLYGVYGSPDDNSSFGYSPSCASLDLRDLICAGLGGGGGGQSPAGLTRGSTCDCLLGPGPGSFKLAAGSNQRLLRRSLDGHQTLTFTSSSCLGVVTEARRESILGCAATGGAGAEAGPGSSGGALKPWQLHQQHQHSHEHRQVEHQHQDQGRNQQQQQQQPHPQGGESSACVNGGSEVGREGGGSERDAAAADEQAGAETWLSSRAAPDAVASPATSVPANGSGGCSSSGTGTGPGAGDRTAGSSLPVAPGCLAARWRRGSSDDTEQCGSFSNENESLGLTDRMILQTMRQQALAQLNASTIPEEAGSSDSPTPVRGCSSDSLTDFDKLQTGQSTPRTQGQNHGRFSHKSLETIDWAAAAVAATEEEQLGNRANGGLSGSCAQPSFEEALAELKLN